MYRRLSLAEMIFVLMPMTIKVSTTTRGTLDRDLLAQAFTHLVEAHPALRARVELDLEEGAALRVSDDAPALEILDADGAEQRIVNTRFPHGGPLVRGFLVPGADGDEVSILVDHVISDGRSSASMLASLWEIYTALVQGDPLPELGDKELPAAMDDRVPHSFSDEDIDAFIAGRKHLAETAQPLSMPVRDDAEPGSQATVAVETIELDEAVTTRLRDVAREQGMSVHGVLSGAILAGLREHVGEGEGPLTYLMLSSVNMRPHVDPPLDDQTMVYAAAGLQTVVQVPAGPDPFALGREIFEDLTGKIERGDLRRMTQSLSRVLEIPHLPITVSVSNIGVVPTPPTPDGVELVRATLVPLAPLPVPAIGIITCAGRLTAQITYSPGFQSTERMRVVAASIERWLHEISTGKHDVRSTSGD